jgi:predicted transcriptional regulator
MPEQPEPLTYEDAARIRREVKQLEQELPRIIVEAREGRSAAEIARELLLTESYVHRILREQRAK